jgi:hypothetical protein
MNSLPSGRPPKDIGLRIHSRQPLRRCQPFEANAILSIHQALRLYYSLLEVLHLAALTGDGQVILRLMDQCQIAIRVVRCVGCDTIAVGS